MVDGSLSAHLTIHDKLGRERVHAGEPLVIHRKGLTTARVGELGIILGSMVAPSFSVRGAIVSG